MKGIILAGGTGSRLYPITRSCSKQLLPVYDKPMIYYPLSTLMIAGIWEVVIIVSLGEEIKYRSLLGDGSHLGMKITYQTQVNPNGLPEALLLAEREFGNMDDGCCLILGDNLFYGNELKSILQKSIDGIAKKRGALIFGYHVPNPEDFGVLEIKDGVLLSIEEKPAIAKSNYAIPGLYFFDSTAVEKARRCKPSPRGETEIIDVIKAYRNGESTDPYGFDNLHYGILKRGITWTDMGTVDSLMLASQLIQSVQKIQGYQIGCIEEIAYRNEWITRHELLRLAEQHSKTYYGAYLRRISDERIN